MDEIIICTNCKGHGFVEHDVGSHNSEYETTKCKKCKGSGRLEETVTVKSEPFIAGPDKAERKF